MKIVVGHKVLNLEELTTIASYDCGLSEVVVDSQLSAELSTAAAADKGDRKPFESGKDLEGTPIIMTKAQNRAALLVKLV